MLKFDIKNKLKIDNKNNSEKTESTEKDTENSLKKEMIASILRRGTTNKEEKPITFVDLESEKGENQAPTTVKKTQKQIESKTQLAEEKPVAKVIEKQVMSKSDNPKNEVVENKPTTETRTINPDTTKITQLIKAIESSEEKMIVPTVDMNHGLIAYPILDQIGEDPTNIELLEKLTSNSFDVLEKTTYERLAVCPQHPESLSVTVRLYCPKCNSMDIEKLSLIEHKRCGYISENTNFEMASDGTIKNCPSCKKEIKNMQKEIAMPAMWYTCTGCKEKFDDVSIKLHCTKYKHDFETNKSHTIVIPGFRIKNLADSSNSSISPILNELKDLLKSHNFSAEENYMVTGKSGNPHHVNIYGEDVNKRTVLIFIKNPAAEDDSAELNSKVIQVLDTSPTVAILIGFPSISEKAKTITTNYNISLVTEQDPSEILSSIKTILSERVPVLES